MFYPRFSRPEPAGQPSLASGSPRKLRAALLGAVAMAAVTGVVVTDFGVSPGAYAAAPATNTASAPASFADVADRVKGTVVSVQVKVTQTASDDDESGFPRFAPGDPLERFFRRFREEGVPFERRKPRAVQSQGSGFIISPDGYVVTNNHVVENASEVTLTLDDGKTVPASVVGTDKKTDLALLKIKQPGTYPYAEFATHTPRVGDWVIAVGNPFGLGGTVTAGIVSARGRDIGAGPYDDFIQIDAPVNRGNSGGPTFDVEGKVVGVNTAIFSPSGGNVGIGFAIPAETAQNVVTALKEKGTVARGWIGVQIQPVTQEIADSVGLKGTKGAMVAEAQANAPAATAGIKSGDVILGIDGERIDGPRDLARKVAALGPGKAAEIIYWRDGAEKTATVKLGTLPEEKEARAAVNGGEEKSALAGLGLTLAPASSMPGAGNEGVVVAEADPDGVGAQKGLRVGDVILEAGGQKVSKPADIVAVLSDAKKAGRKAILLRVKGAQGVRFVAVATQPAS
jgi:serine protease Do